ncbi:MAG: hypothetical protein ABSF57_09195 [Acidobacteriaceae bacterium]|jgi:hypothetical protein
MRTFGCRALAVPFLCVLLTSTLTTSAQTAAPAQTPPTVQPPSNTTYPQIVRIRYLEGDVRVARGKQDEKTTHNLWEQAVVNLPLETGFNLVTGAGRAEIEFEDASTVYLADNSVLTLDDLHTTGGVPHTELTLLTGTVTLHARTAFVGEFFQLRTPTNSFNIVYSEKTYLRITSYLDALAVTPLNEELIQSFGSAAKPAAKGVTVYYSRSQIISPPATSDATAFADWDAWVAGRVAARSAALAVLTKASGLPSSTPGLADMNGQGTFFSCASYGTCWMPSASAPQQPTANTQPASQTQPIPAPDFSLLLSRTSASVNPGGKIKLNLSLADIAGFSGDVALSSTLPTGFSCVTACSGQLPQTNPLSIQLLVDASVPPGDYPVAFTGSAGALQHQAALTVHVRTTAVADFDLPEFTTDFYPYFPCAPYGVRSLNLRNRLTGLVTIVDFDLGSNTPPYFWAVCHSGSWLYRNHAYIWVAGTKRHHRSPIRWVKKDRKVGYVPLHPRDVAGHPPVNAKHEVYTALDKKNTSFQATQSDPRSKIELLNSPPKEFRKPYVAPLDRAVEPAIAAHTVRGGLASSQTGLALRLDQKKQTFLLVSQVTEGGKTKTVAEPFAGRSNLRTKNGKVVQSATKTPRPTTRPSSGVSRPAPTRAPVSRAPVSRAPVSRAPVSHAPVSRGGGGGGGSRSSGGGGGSRSGGGGASRSGGGGGGARSSGGGGGGARSGGGGSSGGGGGSRSGGGGHR